MTLSMSNHPRVLVVEDDASVVRMLRLSLRNAGFEVTATATGREALQFIEGYQADAVVLDLGLLDNWAGRVLDRLRDNDSQPQWLVISAMDRGEAAQRYGPMDDHFIAKPFDPWALVRKLHDLLGVEAAAAEPADTPPKEEGSR